LARSKSSASSGAPNPLGWMVTFSDLVTLLLTFFVLLISMSSMDAKAIQQSFGMFSGATGPLDFSGEGQLSDLVSIVETMQTVPSSILVDQQAIKDAIFQFDDVDFQKLMDLVDKDISIIKDERGLVIQMADYILFSEGGSQLRQEFLPILSKLAEFLRMTRQAISVDGHTDSSALEGGHDLWAWELSLERALAVTRFLTQDEGLMPERFRAGGFGPSQPLVPNDTPQNRAKNRRIELILYDETVG
jgi:chemotaxis protein MotB